MSIELLRFISAFAVLVWHYQHFAYTKQGFVLERDAQPFYFVLAPFYEHGLVGVQVFWCISGFIFFLRYFEELAEGRVSFRSYAIHRFSRLYPLHLLTLIVTAVLQAVYEGFNGYYFVYSYNDLKHFLLNIFFASYWGFQDGYSFNAPVWSVSVEIIVYVLFFAFCRFLRLSAAYVGVIALCLVLSALDREAVANCLMYFFAGGIVALVRFHPGRIFKSPQIVKIVFPAFGLVVVLLSVVLFFALGYQLPGVTAMVYVFVAVNALFTSSAPVWNFLGSLTYSSYLVHFPLQLLFVIVFAAFEWEIDYRNPLLLLLFMSSTLGVSALVFKRVEMPMQRAIRRRYYLVQGGPMPR